MGRIKGLRLVDGSARRGGRDYRHSRVRGNPEGKGVVILKRVPMSF